MARRRSYSRPRRRYSFRRPFYHRRRGGMTIPIAPIAGLIGGLAAGPNAPVELALSGNFNEAGVALMARYTGWNAHTGGFDLGSLTAGIGPLAMGLIVHKVVGGMLGVNRMLAKNRVPYVRV
jgi:hypothetical protein